MKTLLFPFCFLLSAFCSFGQADYRLLAALTPMLPNTNVVTESNGWTYAMAFSSFGKTNTTTGATSYTFGRTATPPANSLMLVAVGNTKASAPDMPTLTGAGVQWVNIGTTNWTAALRLTLFRAMTNAAVTADAVVADFAGATQTGCNIAGVYFVNAATNGWGSGAVVQVVQTTNNSANPSITMAALQGATNGVFAVFENNISGYGADSVDTGWTQDQQFGYGTPANGMLTVWATNTSDNTPSITDGAQPWGAIAVEVQYAEVTTNVPPPSPPGSLVIAMYGTNVGSGSAAVTLNSVPAGAYLVATTANETDHDSPTVGSSPSLSFVKQTDAPAGGGACSIQTALFAAGGTVTVTSTDTGRCSLALYAVTGQNASPIGSFTNSAAAMSTASVTNTTVATGSMIFAVVSDYGGSSSAATYTTPPTLTEYLWDYQSGAYTAWHFVATNAGTAGAVKIGQTAPTTGPSGICTLEIIP